MGKLLLGMIIIAISGVGAWFGWHLASEGWRNFQQQDGGLPHKEETAYRIELIKQWSNGIENIEDSEWWDGMGVSFGDKLWYSSLRQYMNREAIEKLEKPRTLIVPSEGRRGFPKKQILLDEVARIEKEWGLTGSPLK